LWRIFYFFRMLSLLEIFPELTIYILFAGAPLSKINSVSAYPWSLRFLKRSVKQCMLISERKGMVFLMLKNISFITSSTLSEGSPAMSSNSVFNFTFLLLLNIKSRFRQLLPFNWYLFLIYSIIFLLSSTSLSRAGGSLGS